MIKKILVIFLTLFLTCSASHAADDLKSAFSNGNLTGEFRLFQFTRDFDASTDRQDLASGGMLYYRTDPLKGVNVGIAFYTGQEMGLNDDDKDVYGLLATDYKGDHASYSVLGEAFVQGIFENIALKAGRQELETPFVNTDDNRLTPQSTEAYSLAVTGIPDVKIYTSYVTKMRGKAATEFVSMTEYAEISDADEPVILGGIVYEGVEALKLQIWDYYAKDFFNEIYLRADYSHDINDEWAWFGAAQYLKQKAAGDELGGSFDSYTYAVEGGIEAYGFQTSLAFAQVGDDEILIPWGHDLICSIMVNDTVRAEEKGILGALKYDFSHVGVDGLVAKVKHLDFNTPDDGSNASPDKTETDFDIIYEPGGYFENMSMRLRHAIVNKDEDLGGEDYNDTRVMLKYGFQIN